MRLALQTLLLAGLTFACISAEMKQATAQIQGNVNGCVMMRETRGQLTNAAGSLHRNDNADTNGNIPIPEVLLRFTFFGLLPGQLIDPVFVRTNRLGCYSVNWRDPTRTTFPTRARMDIMWSHTEVRIPTDSMPPLVFSIRGSSGAVLRSSSAILPLGANTTVPRWIVGGDTATAYATAWEFFDRVVRGPTRKHGSALLERRMRGIQIWTRQSNVFGGFGVAPTRNWVLVTIGTPTTNPWTVAHELGHIATWNALNLRNAPLNPLTDYVGFTWNFMTRETERAAFLEGIASFFGTAWMWSRTAQAPLVPRGATFFDFEAAADAPAPGTPLTVSCGSPTLAPFGSYFETPFCNGAALWDVYDAPTSDDDGSTRRFISSIVHTLNGYPDDCPYWDNQGCSNEGGPAGLAHNDFRRNFRPAQARDDILDPIYTAVGLTGGTP